MATPVSRGYPLPQNQGVPQPGPSQPPAGPHVQGHVANPVPQNVPPVPQIIPGPVTSAPVQQGPGMGPSSQGMPHSGVPGPGMGPSSQGMPHSGVPGPGMGPSSQGMPHSGVPGPGMVPGMMSQGMPASIPNMPSQVPPIPAMGSNMPPSGPTMVPQGPAMGSVGPGIAPVGPPVGGMVPPGPGMRPPDRPMQIPPQMQHMPGLPSNRQYGVPPSGYQGSIQRPGYSPGPGMQGTPPPQGMHQRVNQSMPPPPNPYTPGRMPPQGGIPIDNRKRDRIPDNRAMMGPKGPYMSGFDCRSGGPPGQQMPIGSPSNSSKKKKKLADKILPQKVRDLVPESQAYMDLLAFERKLDFTIMRKRLDIQEALKRPQKQKRKLRIFISNTFYPAKQEGDGNEEPTVPSWELRVEGRLLDDPSAPKADQSKGKRKFSSFFKSLVIELDKDLYGPDNHLVEWHRTPTTTETDGFQVKRPGDKNVRCTILLLLDYQPLQFKLDSRLARLLGIHTQTRPMIINALWQYIKTHKLQDPHEREYVNCDKYLEQIFQCPRMKFAEIPQRLHQLLHPPDPIVINHIISVEGPDTKKTACYDIDVEVDDPLKLQMNNFLLSTASQQEIQGLDNKIHETVETINQLKTNREFFLSFAKDPQQFIDKWLISQTKDLKTMTDVVGNPEEERRSDFYYQPWSQEAVCRYFYGKVQQRRAELEQALGIRNT